MQIHDLNTKALTDPAYVAFDDGTDTYKADFKAIIDDAVATAIADFKLFKRVDVTVTDVSVPANGQVLLGQAGSISGYLPVAARFVWSGTVSSNVSPTGLQYQSSYNRIRAINTSSSAVTVSGTLVFLYVNSEYVETITS